MKKLSFHPANMLIFLHSTHLWVWVVIYPNVITNHPLASLAVLTILTSASWLFFIDPFLNHWFKHQNHIVDHISSQYHNQVIAVLFLQAGWETKLCCGGAQAKRLLLWHFSVTSWKKTEWRVFPQEQFVHGFKDWPHWFI